MGSHITFDRLAACAGHPGVQELRQCGKHQEGAVSFLLNWLRIFLQLKHIEMTLSEHRFPVALLACKVAAAWMQVFHFEPGQKESSWWVLEHPSSSCSRNTSAQGCLEAYARKVVRSHCSHGDLPRACAAGRAATAVPCAMQGFVGPRSQCNRLRPL